MHERMNARTTHRHKHGLEHTTKQRNIWLIESFRRQGTFEITKHTHYIYGVTGVLADGRNDWSSKFN